MIIQGARIIKALQKQIETESKTCDSDDYDNCDYDVDSAVLT